MSKFNGRSFHSSNVKIRNKKCPTCGTSFKPRSGVHKFCSPKCKGRWKYITGTHSTANQYKEISGNWERYLSRLIYVGGSKRSGLTREDLLKKLKDQDFKCALSGLPLTCNLEVGVKFPYNVSIDRIEAGGSYNINNIQLVCKILNSWRGDADLQSFIDICKAVAYYHNQPTNN